MGIYQDTSHTGHWIKINSSKHDLLLIKHWWCSTWHTCFLLFMWALWMQSTDGVVLWFWNVVTFKKTRHIWCMCTWAIMECKTQWCGFVVWNVFTLNTQYTHSTAYDTVDTHVSIVHVNIVECTAPLWCGLGMCLSVQVNKFYSCYHWNSMLPSTVCEWS